MLILKTFEVDEKFSKNEESKTWSIISLGGVLVKARLYIALGIMARLAFLKIIYKLNEQLRHKAIISVERWRYFFEKHYAFWSIE
ncbi:MAG: hypothetical protein LBN01_02065 [Endomicrobium sp.]|jgi:hypothetical protein|nr:hypothetical protein [Endomicrobium sp.]